MPSLVPIQTLQLLGYSCWTTVVVMGKAKGLRVEVSAVGARVSRKGDGVTVAESEGRGVHSTEEMEVHGPPRSYV